MELFVNGELKKQSNTEDVIFSVAYIDSYSSEFMTLLPSDIVTTVAPSGVGLRRKPPQFLKQGDVVALSIESLGAQTQHIMSGCRFRWQPSQAQTLSTSTTYDPFHARNFCCALEFGGS